MSFPVSTEKQDKAARDEQARLRALLRRVLENEEDAWTELVDSHTGILMSLAGKVFDRYKQNSSKHDREDIVANVWRNLMDKQMKMLRSCLESGQLLPLLHTLVRNRCIDAIRKKGPNYSIPLEDAPDWELVANESHAQFEESADSKIEEALSSLSAKERTCIKLFYLQERSYREISSLTGIPVNSIGPLIRRALDKLQSVMPPKE